MAAFGDTTEPPLPPAVTAGVGVFGWPGVAAAAAVVASFFTGAVEMLVGGADGLFVAVGNACGWVGAGLSVGLGVVIATGGVVMAAVDFADVVGCVGSFFLVVAPFDGAPVVPPTVALAAVGSVLDAVPSVGAADGPGVAETLSFVTEGAVGLSPSEQTLWNRKPREEKDTFIRYSTLLSG